MTTFDKWRAGGELIGLFSLVGSLVFVGLQLQQGQDIAISQAYQARADQSMTLALAALENETTLSFWGKVYGAVDEELTPAENALGGQLAAARLIHWENVHYQYQQGFVSQEHWDTQLVDMRFLMKLEGFKDVYDASRESWRASFRPILDQFVEG